MIFGTWERDNFKILWKRLPILNVNIFPWTLLSFLGSAWESICNPGMNTESFQPAEVHQHWQRIDHVILSGPQPTS